MFGVELLTPRYWRRRYFSWGSRIADMMVKIKQYDRATKRRTENEHP